ncbi:MULTISPECIES: hypothetical protein [unclassified Moorena]|uniref:hypothetical protein n=1 Tax=unclassified Moorena TaxID=2683338 RepID=UPI0013CAA9C2|nr:MULTISPECIES: hypothetical protein [unclassified Moorena]NEO23447.1 hypothetical protein [Moorena sp. SIO4A5]NEQ59998.1 hypothetical protein [Moorena sp. SIO4A1]
MVFGNELVSYQLSAISYQLSAISYQLMRYLPASFAQRGTGFGLGHARVLNNKSCSRSVSEKLTADH